MLKKKIITICNNNVNIKSIAGAIEKQIDEHVSDRLCASDNKAKNDEMRRICNIISYLILVLKGFE